MRIAYAKSKSDVVAKADGTYVERPKKIVKREAPKPWRSSLFKTSSIILNHFYRLLNDF